MCTRSGGRCMIAAATAARSCGLVPDPARRRPGLQLAAGGPRRAPMSHHEPVSKAPAARPGAPAPVPVLVLSGAIGAGKSTVGQLAARLLDEAGLPGALVDLAVIAVCWPAPAADRWNESLVHRDLAAVWANFRQAGAERLILCRILEDRSLLAPIRQAVPGAAITVARLRAPLEVLRERILARDQEPGWFLDAATYLARSMEESPVQDFVVDNHGRPPRDVAREILIRARWLTSDHSPRATTR